MLLIECIDVSLSYGLTPILDNINWTLHSKEKVCVIGRNGAGKSSFLKILKGEVLPDSGVVRRDKNLIICELQQEIPNSDKTVQEILQESTPVFHLLNQYQKSILENPEKDIGDLINQIELLDGWTLDNRIEQVIDLFQLNYNSRLNDLSGGNKRKVLLAASLLQKPDILLLDEPTNHLDIKNIIELENIVNSFAGAVVFISHDRSFLQNVANVILEIDRGYFLECRGNYQDFLIIKDNFLHAQEEEWRKFDKKLSEEEVWIRQGVKARRTRNEGRVRALKKMREERKQRNERQNFASIELNNANKTSKKMISLENVLFLNIISHFSYEIIQGDKIGILGDNGSGKSTLLNLITEKLKPTEGAVISNENMKIIYFDQLRSQLNENLSIKDNVISGGDFVEINGKSKHIISYLNDFLFSAQRILTPVKALSGGERARLLLAKLFTQSFNVLILDEPTNDLDIETLEILENILFEWNGTLIIVSHDRSFLDNVVNQILFIEDSKVSNFFGNASEFLNYQETHYENNQKEIKKNINKKEIVDIKSNSKVKLTYKLQKELDDLPKEIEKLEKKIQKLSSLINASDFYSNSKDYISDNLNELTTLQTKLDTLMMRFIELDEA